ncbi:hypothetical protein DK65_1189 [Brucella pinnipedialis]|nr:hypothetical protein DK65_1189 [Brucella pinnipedialis]ENR18248.1 hypothetical protein C066_00052 [Brucella sp. UK5/01]ENT18099.1 hypothetical protein C067_00104 [Brucella sp. F8/99]ENT24871.1 hypothetical protein C051_00157 [Brucella sp. UK40/99]
MQEHRRFRPEGRNNRNPPLEKLMRDKRDYFVRRGCAVACLEKPGLRGSALIRIGNVGVRQHFLSPHKERV